MKKVLIVDDEAYMLALLERFAKKCKIESCRAINGVEALAVYKKEKPDGVILDIHIPELSGDKVCRAIRETDPDCKIYMLSGSQEAIALLILDNLPATGYILKPFDAEQIIKIMEGAK